MHLSKNKKILIAPLNWGLGHATRCIPVIRELLAQEAEVVLAADGDALTLLKLEFPKLVAIELPSYNIRYPGGKLMWLKIAIQLPGIFLTVFREHLLLNKIIQTHNIQIIIADNRYGLWNKKIKSVFITHQLYIKPPKGLTWLAAFMRKINFFFISRFNECWIPDNENEPNLSGELSHDMATPFKVRFIGPLSRFSSQQHNHEHAIVYDLLVILSGPEPQRTIFEDIVCKQLKHFQGKVMLVRGTAIGNTEKSTTANITTVNHLQAHALEEVINASSLILCRAGYSSIMDLAVMGKKAILIPTPGQTEQEYLATYFHTKKIYFSMNQDTFDLPHAISASTNFKGLKTADDSKLRQIIESLMR